MIARMIPRRLLRALTTALHEKLGIPSELLIREPAP